MAAKRGKGNKDEIIFPETDDSLTLSDEEVDANEEVVEPKDQIGETYYPIEYNISSYGADYPVDGLVARITKGSIYIPSFQRSYVWNIYRASRFIESLLLGLPVPAIFLSKELESSKMLVIDGQQRLRTLEYFYKEIFDPTEKVFKLKGVLKKYEGRTYSTLDEDDRIKLDDSIIHAIVVKQENPTEDGDSGISPSSAYHIFERLNTGGMLLQPQEIRSCAYHGKLMAFLDELNTNSDWRSLFGKVSARMRDRELILRFLALYYSWEKYSKPMKEFLNHFAAEYRDLPGKSADDFSSLFVSTVSAVKKHLGTSAFKKSGPINAALYDAIMMGVAMRLTEGPITKTKQLQSRYSKLLEDDDFQNAISSGTTNENNVRDRIQLARKAFSGVK